MSDRRVSSTLMSVIAATAALALLPGKSRAALKDTFIFDVPAQQLPLALNRYSEQAGVQVSSPGQLIEGKMSSGVTGKFEARAALDILLKDTQLSYDVIDNKTVAIMPVKAATARLSEGGTTDEVESKKESLEEIVVTAQKRAERLQDVPVPVTAIGADSLVANNQLRIEDYYATVPGLNFSTGIYGEPFIAIRGITTDPYTSSTVSTTVDDVPYGSSTTLGAGSSAPDIDPSDLERIEVLRGPQGTLYGASSMGGLLKYVTVDPSTEALGGRLQASASNVSHGHDLGYSVRGSANVPLGTDFAVRASAFTRRDPGYVDDPSLGTRGVNQTDTHGGRLSALWRPASTWSVKLTALFQERQADGSSHVDVQPGLDDLQHVALLGTGGYERKSESYSANVTARLGTFDLTSVTGYNIDTVSDSLDFTPALGSLAESFFGVGGSSVVNEASTEKLTQEIRFTTPIGSTLDWLFGAFYTHEDSAFEQELPAVNPATGASAGSLLHTSLPTTYEEYAAFTDVTFHMTDKFDVQIGGRQSQNRQDLDQRTTGALVGSGSVVQGESKDSAFTYLVTPSLKVSSDLMVYARFASGYRPGGPNTNTQIAALPAEFGPDKTQNYEIGVKGTLLDRALSFDASLYYIDWKQIQILLRDSGFSFRANGSRAKSQGVEVSIESRPMSGTVIAAWVAWNQAELTEELPTTSTVVGLAGDRLPNSARISGSISLDQEIPLTSSVQGFVGGTVSYVGDRLDVFSASSQRQIFPAYARSDLRAGMRFADWTLNVFVNNVADRRGVLTKANFPNSFFYIQPRTAGLALSRVF